MESTKAQQITDIIWGRTHLTLMDKLSIWFWGQSPTGLPMFTAADTTSRLSKIKLTDDQIYQIRDAYTQATYIARNYIIKKYNIEERYQCVNQDSFGVYQLFLNVGYDALREFAKKTEQLFYNKLLDIQL